MENNRYFICPICKKRITIANIYVGDKYVDEYSLKNKRNHMKEHKTVASLQKKLKYLEDKIKSVEENLELHLTSCYDD